MASQNVSVNLANGQPFPLFGLGTWQSKENEVRDAVREAIQAGYRHIDSAAAYGNEGETGAAIKEKIEDGTVKREELFVTTKLQPVDNRASDVEGACKTSLAKLGLEYVDLYLMHWPFSFEGGHGVGFPKGPDGNVLADDEADYLDTWRAMEALVDKGLARAIGVCNFTIDQMKRLLSLPPRIPISNLQIECHPYLNCAALLELCKANNIVMTAYSPLGSPGRPVQSESDPRLLDDPVVVEIAKSKSKSAAQVLIRYQIERGVAVIPKSVKAERIRSNMEALQFELTSDEVQRLNGINKGFRYIWFNAAKVCKYHPYK